MSKYKLEDLCSLITDGSHWSPKGVDDGIPMASVKDMYERGIDLNSCKQISKKEYEKLVKNNCIPEIDDILIAKDGSYLKHVFVWEDDIDIGLLSSIAILRPQKDKVIPKYLSLVLEDPHTKKRLSGYVSGVALPRIILKDFRKFKIDLPSIEVQKKIASTLSAFDDLIENNSRRIEILEEIARRIYREWFVHFRYPGHEDDDPSTGSGQRLVDSGTELGEIPEGWEVKQLKNFLKFKNGKSPETKEGVEYPVYGSNGIIGKCNEPRWEDGVIIGRVGAYCGSVEYCEGKFWGSDNTIVATTREEYDFSLFAYYKLEGLNLRRYAGGSAQPLMTQTVIKDIKIAIPRNDLLVQFSEQARRLWKFKRNLEKKNRKLKETRDLLLPKLISGKIDVEEMELESVGA